MRFSCTYKLLYLLNLLSKGKYTKKEIIKNFKEADISITKPAITGYIKKMQLNGIDVVIEKKSKENHYSVKKQDAILSFTKKELDVIQDLKKLLIAQKNPQQIRKTMKFFYKMAHFIKDEEQRLDFVNFGYYSTLNWHLIKQLQRHARQKNVVKIDYIHPLGGNRYITMHIDDVRMGDLSDRLYVYGILEGSNQFSQLPVDRVFMVKKIIEKNVPINIEREKMTYIISRELFDEIKLDYGETLIKKTKTRVTIQREIDNDFYIIQRLLYFCPELYYISDSRIKKLFKEKLEMLKAAYDREFDK